MLVDGVMPPRPWWRRRQNPTLMVTGEDLTG
jgi:hypothetical protein